MNERTLRRQLLDAGYELVIGFGPGILAGVIAGLAAFLMVLGMTPPPTHTPEAAFFGVVTAFIVALGISHSRISRLAELEVDADG